MKVGLVGYGAWGKFHARALARHPELELAAISCHSEKTAEVARRDFSAASVFTDYRDLLQRQDIELVDIVLPIYLHAEVGVAALEAGKNVILEKPMARTVEECDDLVEAAKRNGRLLTISHDWRATNSFAITKDKVSSGDLGELRYMSVNLFRNRFRRGANDWRITPEKVGSWILEEPVHFFDLVLWYMEADHGDPVSVYATGNGPRSGEGLFENFTATMRFATGAYATVTQTLGGFEHHHTVQLVGSQGAVRTWWSAEMDRANESTLGYQFRTRDMPFERGVNECRTLDIQPENHQTKIDKQIERIIAAFKKGSEPTPGIEARKRVFVCMTAEQSAREGREIALAM